MARLAPTARCRIGGRLYQRHFAQSLLHPTEPHEPSVLSPRPGGARTQVIEREESELENSSSTTTEKDNVQKARRQDRRRHRRHRRDWVSYGKAFRQRGCLCLHHGPPTEGTRGGREGNRHQRFWSSRRRCPIGRPGSSLRDRL